MNFLSVLLVLGLFPIASAQFQDLLGWTSRGLLVPSQVNFLCSNGPPGFYCKIGLASYFDCQPDGSQIEVSCPAGTRCSCFVGPRCASSVIQPCQPLSLPPLLPGDISTVSFGQLLLQTPVGPTTYKFNKQQYQVTSPGQLTKRGDRQDTTWTTAAGVKHMRSIHNSFISQGASTGLFTRYVGEILHNGGGTCISTTPNLPKMPVVQVPAEAHEDGFETVVGETAHRWVVNNGGQNLGVASSVEYFYYVNDLTRGILRPIRYFAKINFGLAAKVSLTVNETFGLFYPQLVPSMGFYAMRPTGC